MHQSPARINRCIITGAGEFGVADDQFKVARALFQEIKYPQWLAVTAVQHAESLQAGGRREEAEPLLEEARDIFVRLGAEPWIARIDQASQADRTVGVVPA